MTEFDFWFVMIVMVRAVVCVMLCGVLESLPPFGGAGERWRGDVSGDVSGATPWCGLKKKVVPLQGLPTEYCPMAGMPLARWQRRCGGGKGAALKICRY